MKTEDVKATDGGAASGTVTLNNGVMMPRLGLGVFRIRSDAEAEAIVREAIELGYRSFDTAALYGNERGVGRAVRGCGVRREELFITTKVWNDDVRQDRVEAACEESLKRLGLDYVDLYLVHWPIRGKIAAAWRAMERVHGAGWARAIGVSNHLRPHLAELGAVEVQPAVNQIEFHPYLQSKPLHEQCRAQGIQLEAWSPLMQGGAVLRDEMLAGIARRHGRTVAQVVLRWEVQSGVVTIPKSAKRARLAENAAIFDFELSELEMAEIVRLDRGERSGADPMNFSF